MNYSTLLSACSIKRISSLALLFATLIISSAVYAQVERPGKRDYPFNEHTPSYREMVSGMRAFRAGQYPAAASHYKNASRWADKFAQYNVGVMYLRGNGVTFDPVRAWAWFELSAERNYPIMAETADQLWDMFEPPQQRRARDIYENELLPKFGDAERKEVTARRMLRERRPTGSRVGATGFLTIIDRSGRTRDGGEFYAKEKWDFYNIVQYEGQMMRTMALGRVELGELVLKEDEPEPDQENL